jgi:glycosyltransferase involved in cell wall biosynthesis
VSAPGLYHRSARRVCVVGSGDRFVSGISYHTNRLANELAADHEVSVILMRQLLPTRLYPGRDRVGSDIVDFRYPPGVDVLNGVDWYWVPSMARALAFLRRQQPDVIILQWWTGTVIHSYLALAAAAKLMGAKVVVEFHETLDTGELRVPLVGAYVRTLAPALFRLADGAVVHSEYDRAEIGRRYPIEHYPVVVAIPPGLADAATDSKARSSSIPYGRYDRSAAAPPTTHPPDDSSPCRLLYFGVIRPFNGLEDLVAAFNALSPAEAEHYTLTVVGETWESWTLPNELIAASPYRERINFVNRYVSDADASGYFERADVVVLPYRRSSASGPLNLAMSHGLPVLVTEVGGLAEAAAEYEGKVAIAPSDPASIRRALPVGRAMVGRRFADPNSWARTVARLDTLFDEVTKTPRSSAPTSEPT